MPAQGQRTISAVVMTPPRRWRARGRRSPNRACAGRWPLHPQSASRRWPWPVRRDRAGSAPVRGYLQPSRCGRSSPCRPISRLPGLERRVGGAPALCACATLARCCMRLTTSCPTKQPLAKANPVRAGRSGLVGEGVAGLRSPRPPAARPARCDGRGSPQRHAHRRPRSRGDVVHWPAARC